MAYTETWSGKINRKLIKKRHIIDVAAGRCKADLVLKNATYVNVFSGELETRDIAVAEGLIVGLGTYEGIEEADMTGRIVCPGFLDAHSRPSPFWLSSPFSCTTAKRAGAARRFNMAPISSTLCIC